MKNLARSRVMKDSEIIGQGMPMASASEKPICLNDILFQGTFEDWRNESSFKILAHRVIQLNYKYRYVRIRCPNGCESTINFEDGCSRLKYFHSITDCKSYLIGTVVNSISKCTDEIVEKKKQIQDRKNLIEEIREITSTKIPGIVK